MRKVKKCISIFLIVSFLSLSFPVQALPGTGKGKGKKAAAKPEVPAVVKLEKAFSGALQRTDQLLSKVERGDVQATAKIAEKVAALKGIRKAYLYQFAKIEELLNRYSKKGIVSPEKRRRFQDTKGKLFDRLGSLVAVLSTIDASKSSSDNASAAVEAKAEIQVLASEVRAGAPPPPDPKKFQFTHRTARAEGKEPKHTKEILKQNLEQDDPTASRLPTPYPPTPQDLSPTLDIQITPEIIEKANELGRDPNRIFRFVHDTIAYEPYWGSQKGSLETLFDRAANDLDQCSLLMALLRASGIPARYEWGTAQIRIKPLMNWIGVPDPQVAVNILYFNGVFAAPILRGGKIRGAIFEHFWVIAYVDGKWWRLDPSFKQYDVTEPADISGITGFEIASAESIANEGAVIHVGSVSYTGINFLGLEQYIRQQVAKLGVAFPTLQNLYGERRIKPANGAGLPHHLPLRIWFYEAAFSEIYDTLQFRAQFELDGITLSFKIPEVANKCLSIEYIPATPEDAAIIEAAGGIYNVIPAYLVNMKAVVKLDGAIVGVGSSVPLGYFQIFRSTFEAPNFVLPITNEKFLSVGATYAVGLRTERTTFNQALRKRINDLRSLRSQGPLPEDRIKEVLWLKIMTYFIFTDQTSEGMARFGNIVWTRLPTESYASKDIVSYWLLGLPYQVVPGGFGIDVRDVVLPFAKVGLGREEINDWMLASIGHSSGEEHLINEEIHDVPSVSTMKILELSSKQSIPIHIIHQGNLDRVLPLLEIDQSLKEYVSYLVNLGLGVIIPRKAVSLNEWSGTGFIVIDPATGGSAFIISGGTGESTSMLGGATSIAKVDPWAPTAMAQGSQAQATNFDEISSGGGFEFKEKTDPPSKEKLMNTYWQDVFAAGGFMLGEGTLIITGAGVLTAQLAALLTAGSIIASKQAITVGYIWANDP